MESSLSFRKRAGAFGRDRNGHIIYAAGNGSTQRGHPEKNFLIATPPRYLPSFFPSWSVEKLLPLLPPYPMEPPWAGRLDGWWQHFFLGGKKGCCHHFYPFFIPKRPKEGEETGGRGPHAGKRRRIRTRRNRKPDRQCEAH